MSLGKETEKFCVLQLSAEVFKSYETTSGCHY